MTPLNPLFVERIKKQFPEEAEQFLQAIDKPVVVSVRLHPRKWVLAENDGNKLGELLGMQVPWNRSGYWLKERPNYTLNAAFHGGVFYPQEASSMVLQKVLETIGDELPEDPIVLDLCAAPGGKSTLVASWLDGRGMLVANEIVRQRAWVLRENIAKWGYGNCVVLNSDSERIGSLGAMFDLVLIDAPCSGEGMFRKDDTARTEWSAENAEMCAKRQKEILTNIWDAVVDGGIVIYSTCTFYPEENEKQMEWLGKEMDVEFIKIEMSEEWNIKTLKFDNGEGYAFHPHRVDGEGLFICAMRKSGGMARRKIKTGKKDSIVEVKNCNSKAVSMSEYTVYQQGEMQYAFPRKQAQTMAYIAEQLKAIWMGIPLGQQSKKEIIPAAELALSLSYQEDTYPEIKLDENDTLHYLRGEWTYNGETPQGWCIVKNGDTRLGFVKIIGTRVNNYWPKEWRVRMTLQNE